jgi:hypothetical protein
MKDMFELFGIEEFYCFTGLRNIKEIFGGEKYSVI